MVSRSYQEQIRREPTSILCFAKAESTQNLFGRSILLILILIFRDLLASIKRLVSKARNEEISSLKGKSSDLEPKVFIQVVC